MDLFATTLITITAVTICGICLFIFVCAFQPRLLRKLHGKTSRTYQDTDSNADNLSVKSLDLTIETTDPTADNSSTSPQSKIRDKKAYLKALEQSLRTGRRMHNAEDDDDDENTENQSRLNPFNFIYRFINKHIRRRTIVSTDDTDL